MSLTERHEGLRRLVAAPEHDSDCAIEEAGGARAARIGTACTCVAGNAARVALAVLHAHRPEKDSGLCESDGVLCVDSCENPNSWPCPTVQLIAHAIDRSS